MKTKRVRKSTVIKALEREPLERGSWAHFNENGKRWNEALERYVEVDRKNCSVCAVGAVLRQTVTTDPDKINELGFVLDNDTEYSICQYPERALDAGEHMVALSAFFESMGKANFRKSGIIRAKGRRKLIKFVEDYFPAMVEVPVAGDSEV